MTDAERFADEFSPYLAEQLRDPEVKAAYDGMTREELLEQAMTRGFPDLIHRSRFVNRKGRPRSWWSARCPVCAEPDGFHDDRVHAAIVIPRELILDKGWLRDQRQQGD